MSIQATSGAAAPSAVVAKAATQNSAVQEATETAAVTKAEAAKGDQQAIRKLAMQQQPSPASVSPEGVGKMFDLTA